MYKPKWAPKSSGRNRTKHSFSGHILPISFFGMLFAAAPRMPIIAHNFEIPSKNIGFIDVSTPPLGPTSGAPRHVKNDTKMEKRAPRSMGALRPKKNERHAAWERFLQTKKRKNERHAAWERSGPKRTSATLHGNAFCMFMVQHERPPETFIFVQVTTLLTFCHPTDADASCWQSVH
jgi:hypothetical protein